jgi:ribonuclease VapC
VTVPRPPADDMVVDTSAIVALLLDEPAAPSIARALAASASPIMSAPTLTELGIVAEARAGTQGGSELRALLEAASVHVIPLDDRGAERAVDSWRRFGKGRHTAGLNLGDCFTHELATRFDLPILCVGEDFVRTDAAVVDLAGYA